jgi:glycosyltransferase involved in cell wall biosynthesis
MQNLAARERAGIIPGKTYEYLAAGKPILAAVPEGDAREIVRGAGTGLVCDPDDVAGMAEIIRLQIERWRRGDVEPRANREYIQRFERRPLTAELANLLHEVVAEGVPGRRAIP